VDGNPYISVAGFLFGLAKRKPKRKPYVKPLIERSILGMTIAPAGELAKVA